MLLATLFRPLGASAEEYTLQPGDIVEITVLEDSNLNRRVLVGPDGNIAMPLAGTIQAGGRTLAAMQNAIASRLRGQFVLPPSVTASLVALGPPGGAGGAAAVVDLSTVYILGEVQRPGRYDYKAETPITVLQALALAGGPGVFAARSRIQVREPGDSGDTVHTFDYAAIENGRSAEAPPIVQNGAVIVVPEKGLFE